MDLLCCILFLLFMGGFVTVLVLGSRAEDRQDEEDRREIAKFPADVQIRLWAAKCRLDAERDLH